MWLVKIKNNRIKFFFFLTLLQHVSMTQTHLIYLCIKILVFIIKTCSRNMASLEGVIETWNRGCGDPHPSLYCIIGPSRKAILCIATRQSASSSPWWWKQSGPECHSKEMLNERNESAAGAELSPAKKRRCFGNRCLFFFMLTRMTSTLQFTT